MAKKMMSPNSRVDWIPVAGLTGLPELKISQLNAGTNLSGAVVTGYTLGAADSGVDTSKTIVDEGTVETQTSEAYEGKLNFFRDPIGTGTQLVPEVSTAFTTAFNVFKTPHAEGYLVHRLGKKASVPYAVGDIVSVYRFKNDYLKEIDSDDNGPMQIEVEFLPQGEMYLNRKAVA